MKFSFTCTRICLGIFLLVSVFIVKANAAESKDPVLEGQRKLMLWTWEGSLKDTQAVLECIKAAKVTILMNKCQDIMQKGNEARAKEMDAKWKSFNAEALEMAKKPAPGNQPPAPPPAADLKKK